MKIYNSKLEPHRPFGSISGMLAFVVCWFKETLRGAKKGSKNNQQSISNVLCLPYQPALWFPTAFTPNGDGLNDTFALQGISIKEFNMQIYNRWGEKLFKSNSLYDGWDGKLRDNLCPPDVYTVIIKACKQNGQSVFYSGYVLLIR